jgi:hypothetical protein
MDPRRASDHGGAHSTVEAEHADGWFGRHSGPLDPQPGPASGAYSQGSISFRISLWICANRRRRVLMLNSLRSAGMLP